jgi:hypothetical protein
MRGLVPVEIAIVLVIAILPLPDPIPVAIPLVVAASLAKWIRGASWSDVGSANGFHALVGLAAGIAGLVLALVGGTPIVEALTSRTVEWSVNAVVRGNFAMLGGVVIFAAMASLCMEAALRGWIVERALELSSRGGASRADASRDGDASRDDASRDGDASRDDTSHDGDASRGGIGRDAPRDRIPSSQIAIAVLVGAFAEAVVTPGDLTVRIGAAIYGIGLGWLYVASKRNVIVPILARMTFTVVLVILEGMRVV